MQYSTEQYKISTRSLYRNKLHANDQEITFSQRPSIFSFQDTNYDGIIKTATRGVQCGQDSTISSELPEMMKNTEFKRDNAASFPH
jgi:hypothetical protein